MNSTKKKIAVVAQVLLYIYAAVHILHVIVWTIKPLRFWSFRTFENVDVTGITSCFVSSGVINMLKANHNKALYTGETIRTAEEKVKFLDSLPTVSVVIWIVLAAVAIAVAIFIKKKMAKMEQIAIQQSMQQEIVVNKQEEEFLFICSKCNAKLKEFSKFCPNCSAPSSDFIMKM